MDGRVRFLSGAMGVEPQIEAVGMGQQVWS